MPTKPFAFTSGQTVPFDDLNSLVDNIYQNLGSVEGDRIPEGAGLTTDQMADKYHLESITRELLPFVNHSCGGAPAVFDLTGFTTTVQTFRVPANGAEIDLGAPVPYNAPSGRKGYLAGVSVYVEDIDLDTNSRGVGLKIYKGDSAGWTLLGGSAVELLVNQTWYYLGFTDIFSSPAIDMANGDFIKFAVETFTGAPATRPSCRGLTAIVHYIKEHFS